MPCSPRASRSFEAAGAAAPAPLRLSNGRAVPVRMTRRKNARRFVLRVSGGVIQLTIPTGSRPEEARAWALTQEPFILRELASEPEHVAFRSGVTLPVFGTPRLLRTPALKDALLPAAIEVAATRPGAVHRRCEALLKAHMLSEAERDCAVFWGRLGVAPAEVGLRSFARRWGSCRAPDGQTLFNWRLVFAPRFVLRHVAAHEAAHRVEMNHGSAFKALLEELDPRGERAKRWLREHGSGVYAYGRPPET